MPLQSRRKRKGFTGTQYQEMRSIVIDPPVAASEEDVPVAEIDGTERNLTETVPAASLLTGSSAKELSSMPSSWKNIRPRLQARQASLSNCQYRHSSESNGFPFCLQFVHECEFYHQRRLGEKKWLLLSTRISMQELLKKHSFPTSEVRPADEKRGRSQDVNSRAVLACLAMGSSRADFYRFCGVFNMPPLIGQDIWENQKQLPKPLQQSLKSLLPTPFKSNAHLKTH